MLIEFHLGSQFKVLKLYLAVGIIWDTIFVQTLLDFWRLYPHHKISILEMILISTSILHSFKGHEWEFKRINIPQNFRLQRSTGNSYARAKSFHYPNRCESSTWFFFQRDPTADAAGRSRQREDRVPLTAVWVKTGVATFSIDAALRECRIL